MKLFTLRHRFTLGVAAVLCVIAATSSHANAQTIRVKNMMRIFWQDRDTDQLSYADITASDKWGIKRGWISGFPKLDAERQDLVQMKASQGVLVVGVRDHDDGKHQSGWVSIDTGVFEEAHGDHSHWKYTGTPRVTGTKLDAEQGNPAHLCVYDNNFYLANDQKNGFSRLQPMLLKQTSSASGSAKFFPGGGSHITMASVNNSVAYSSWIDGGGPNAGRVDVVSLNQTGEPKIAYSFTLPSGVIHGATANSGKVFFAPADGICWVNADLSLQKTAETVQVNHLSLGKDEEADKPLRTGAFTNERNWVLCTTGKGDQSALCLINAEAAQPSVVKVSIPVADGLRLTTPETVLSLGNRYAFLFQDRTDAESDVQEHLTVVELDPNRDRDFRDARVKVSIPVGASKIDGHHGHHAIDFDAFGRYGVFTEPGEGMVNVFSIKDMRVVARFKVGGSPDSIVVVGAQDHFH
ncbi:MAG: hypothetical protein R3C59_13980 [Planctomycetaceae bacterium]